MSAIRVEAFSKFYGSFTAVDRISFDVQPGEVLGLCGPNGAGKTTTLRAIAGIVLPSLGRIEVCGEDVQRSPVRAKKHLAFVPDEPGLFEHLTVVEHLSLMARLYGTADGPARAERLLEELELVEKRDELSTALSRGMKQKLALACALVHAPKVLILDEPLTGLDPVAIRRTKNRILECAGEGTAVILSSHLLSLVEEMCHRVLFLKRGKVAFFGSKTELSQAHPDLAATNLEEAFLKLTASDASPPTGTA